MSLDQSAELEQLKRAVLLKRLQQKNAAVATAPAQPQLRPVARDGQLPLSFAQQRLWFLDQLDARAGSAYQIRAALRLRGPLDQSVLKRALDTIVDRHEVLRSRFAEVQGVPTVQITDPGFGFEWVVEDLSALTEEVSEAAVESLFERETERRFDLRQGPLIRGHLLRLGEQDWLLWLAQHHIISDAWSIGVLINELNALYRAGIEGRALQLPPLSVQYVDYACWQHEAQRGGEMQTHLEFWRQHLTGAPALLELPTDRPRRQERSFAGALLPIDLGPTLSEGLSTLSKRHGTSLFATLLASWAALLSRLCGQDDIVIGTPVANRPRRELEGLIGFFVNTLALRVSVASSDTTSSLLAQVRELSKDAFSHAELPFDQLVEALQPVRSAGHSPLFQTMLALDNTGGAGTLSLPGIEATAVALPYRATHYDLTLSLAETGPTISGSLGYSVELFERSTVEGFVRCWLNLLAGMVADDQTRIVRLPLLDMAQVVSAQAAPANKPPVAAVHLRFADWAQRTPTAVAVTCGQDSWTYAQIEVAANRLASRLRACGVGSEDIVGLCVTRSVHMVIGVLGILKAGAAYLPLDPAYPRERLDYMMGDSWMRLLVCETRTALPLSAANRADPGLEPLRPRTLAESKTEARRADHNGLRQLLIDDHSDDGLAALPAVSVQPDQAAYLIYTSGSTGQPKGVLATHGGLANVVAAYQQAFPLQTGSRVLHFVSLSFDAATAHLFLALCSGATLHIHDRHAADARELTDVLRSERINYVGLPVSVLGALSETDLPDLQYLSTGTEACPLQLVERWGDGRRFVNIYGPTETSICSTMSVFDPGRGCSALQRPPIGRPVQGTCVYVLDGELQPVPNGVVGELYIGGDGVTRGYLGQHGLTAERFLPDLFGQPGARMYRTGDLVRCLAEGELDFVGRRDGQIKLRGFRIELGEVEAALRSHPAVQAAAATLCDPGTDQARLIGYVVGNVEDLGEVGEHLRHRLPAHLLPSALIRIDRLPLTANGKLDRAALPRPVEGAADSEHEPQGETARQLATLWGELLRRDRVSADADFFALGGHSLLATQLIARINRHFGTALPLKLVFDAPQLQHMAARIDAELALAGSPRPEPIVASTDLALPQPLSFAQQRLWFLEQLTPGDTSYHIPGALRLRGRLHVEALRLAFAQLQTRHAVLRSRMVEIDGVPMQLDDASATMNLPLFDIGADELPQRLALHAQQPFDFACAPLWRACLLRLDAEEHVLLVTMHHIISDGWSLGILIRELSETYRATLAGDLCSPLPLPLQYTDFARWQRHWLAAGELDRQLGYWRTQLAGLPPLLELPTDRPRPRERSGQGVITEFELDADLVAGLQRLCAEQGVTLFMTLLAAFKVLLARLSGESDIFVGTLVANRTRVELEPLIGFFVNTLVLRNQVDPEQDFPSFLQQVRSTTLEAYAHQDLPFEQLVETLRPARSLAYTPLFQVLCSMQNTPGAEVELPGLEVQTLSSDLGMAKFDLSFDFKQVDTRVLCEVEYASDLFTADTIACWINGFRYLIGTVAQGSSRPIGQLPIGDPETVRQFQEARQGELRAMPEGTCVPAQIIAQAARRPTALAYVGSGRSLSYGELDRRSNQLARELQSRGVRAEVPVGICLSRSPELAVAILAVWKAGGVYLPMDPDYPAARLDYMLKDAGAALVLANRSAEVGAGTEVCSLDPTDPSVAAHSDTELTQSWSATQLAYLIYTSGSTGMPKGVQVEHRALAQHCHGVLEAYGLNHSDRVLHFAALGFDISLDQLLPTWVAGATVVARDPQLWTPRELAEQLIERDITVADLPSALWHLVAREWSVDTDLPVNPRLRLFLVGGEAMASESLRHWRQTPYAPVPLLNGYGPTETTITSSGHLCREDGPTATVPIGRPFANRRFHVLDEQLQQLPAGFPGELYIGGEGLARGYRQLPGLTASLFLPDPYSVAANGAARMYRSGDRVRFRADGLLEFLGRVDGQIKLQGVRIELEEVESALRALPGVRDAAAAVRVLANGDRRLVGYLLLEPGVALAAASLRNELARNLPDHFVPSVLMAVDSLPLMNGKIHRKLLPTPEPVVDESTIAPRNPTETWLAALWAELLGLSEVGVESDFFSLGGHSLLATQLLARVRRHCGLQLPVRQLFDGPTVAEMAACIDSLTQMRLSAAAARTAETMAERDEIEL